MLLRQLLLHWLIATTPPVGLALSVTDGPGKDDAHAKRVVFERRLDASECESELADLGLGLKRVSHEYYVTDIRIDLTSECSGFQRKVIGRITGDVMERLGEKMSEDMNKLLVGTNRAAAARTGSMESDTCTQVTGSAVIAKSGGALRLCYDDIPETKLSEEILAIKAKKVDEMKDMEKKFFEMQATQQVESDIMDEIEEQQQLEDHLEHKKLEAKIAKDMIDYRLEGEKMKLDHLVEIKNLPDAQGLEEVKERHETEKQEYIEKLKLLEATHADEKRKLEGQIEEEQAALKRKREDIVKRHKNDVRHHLEDAIVTEDTEFVFDEYKTVLEQALVNTLKKKKKLARCWKDGPALTLDVRTVNTEGEAEVDC